MLAWEAVQLRKTASGGMTYSLQQVRKLILREIKQLVQDQSKAKWQSQKPHLFLQLQAQHSQKKGWSQSLQLSQRWVLSEVKGLASFSPTGFDKYQCLTTPGSILSIKMFNSNWGWLTQVLCWEGFWCLTYPQSLSRGWGRRRLGEEGWGWVDG